MSTFINIFDDLLTQLTNLTYRRTKGDVKIVEKTLDEFMKVKVQYFAIPPHKSTLLVNQCCTLVHPDDENLVSKCCKLIACFVSKQNVVIEGKTCTIAINWCLEALRQNSNCGVIIDVLTALVVILKSNSNNIHDYTQEIINKNSIIMKLSQDKSNLDQLILSIQCLEASTVYIKGKKAIKKDFTPCLNIFNTYLTNNNFDEPHRSKLIISCLGGLQNILNHDKVYSKTEIGFTLGIVRSYMFYGIKDIDFIPPQKLLPSVGSIPEPEVQERRVGPVAKQRRYKNVDWKKGQQDKTDLDQNPFSNEKSNFTSDSELSDAEVNTPKIAEFQTKVRLRALNIFYDITLIVNRRTLFSYSVHFIPDGWPAGTHSLTSLILRDPSRTCRSAALHVLLVMLVVLKQYFNQAESNDKNTPFTTFSVTLGSIIVELHRNLRLALNDVSANIRRQVMKCMAALVQATPYHRLKPGLLTRNVKSLKPILSYKDPNLKSLTLIVFECMLSSYPTVPEAIIAFSKNTNNPDYNSESSTQSKSFQDIEIDYACFSSDEEESENISEKCFRIPWLVQYCLNKLGVCVDDNGEYTVDQNVINPTEKLEPLKIFVAMANNYFTTFIAPYFKYVLKALELSLVSKSVNVKLQAGRAVNFIGYGISEYLANNSDRTVLTIEQGLFYWNTLLSGPLSQLIEHESDSLRTEACQCLENIGKIIFECLSKDKQMLVMMTLLAFSKNTEVSLNSTAVRALSVCILYPSLRGDIGFLTDTIEVVIQATNHENCGVVVSAYWAFGNVSDALIENETDQIEIESLPKSVWIKLFNCGLNGTTGHFKNKQYAVRALGNFIFVRTKEDLLDEDFKSLSMKSIKSIVNCARNGENAKIKWNACYSLGKLAQNDHLFTDNSWQAEVFHVLLDLVVGSKYFKIRINAAAALACFKKREYYGEFYGVTWSKLLEALENSENMEDFTEYKHRDHLVDQICLSIGNLTSIMEHGDLKYLTGCINFYEDILKSNMQKVYLRLIPEKSRQLLLAEEHLHGFSFELSHEQGIVVEILRKIFNSEILKE